MMTCTGTLFLSRKTKPCGMTAKDGVFALTLLAFDREGPHTVESYRLIWNGPAALAFWETHAGELQPDVALAVELTRLQCLATQGQPLGSEITAHVNSLQLLPSHAKSSQHLQAKTHASPCMASVSSY